MECKKTTSEERPISSSWSATNGLKDFMDRRHERERNDDNSAQLQHSTSTFTGSLPKEILHPTFATGWATSEEIKPFSQIGPAVQEDRNDQAYLSAFWPVHDLGLKNLQVSNDDELGM